MAGAAPGRRRSRATPAAVTRPALALAAVALAFFGIARTTGSGWLIVLLTGIASAVAVATLLPAAGLGRVTLAVDAPRDGTVGRPADLTVTLGGGARPLKVRPLGFDGAWTGVVTPCRGRLAARPLRRGVLTEITLEVRSAAPLGLVWWKRQVTVGLARPLEVGPRPLDPLERWPEGQGADGEDGMRVASALADAVKTIREYAPGDPIKLVHWAATARAGELMVKELESPAAPVLVVAVDLAGAPPEAVELAASRAAGVAIAAVQDGVGVTLLTAEPAGPRTGGVSSVAEVGRRLARAVAGPLPPAPAGTVALVIRARATAGPGR